MELWILPDVAGAFLTGVFIGVQSNFVDNDAQGFFWWFFAILAVDSVCSMLSLLANGKTLNADDSRNAKLWVGNNVVFAAVILTSLISLGSVGHGSEGWFAGLAMLNCGVSTVISYHGYFHTTRKLERKS